MDDMDYGKDTMVRWEYSVMPLDASGQNNPVDPFLMSLRSPH